MSDLLLEDFRMLPNDAFAELLSKERKKIFGGEEPHREPIAHSKEVSQEWKSSA
jgi:hypothetical protein